jgi:uracil-DNA glycosylase
MTKEELEQIIHPSWVKILLPLFNDERMNQLLLFMDSEIEQGYTIYPNKKNVFKAFKLCSFDSLRVIWISQDPYHGPNQATGLCFAVENNIKPPPSLVNILKELDDNYPEGFLGNTNLESWAKHGCLMLNTALTVRANSPGSHSKQWIWFTTEVIKRIQEYRSGLIFVRWGNHAKQFKINDNHHVLDAGHPSPLNTSVPFRGNKHFLKINEIISGQNGPEYQIDWFK